MNRLVKGIICLLVSIVLFISCVAVAKVYGYPANWYEIFGHPLAEIYTGFYIVLGIGGTVLFWFIGLLICFDWLFENYLFKIKAKIFEVIPKEIVLLILVALLFIPSLASIVYLVAKLIVPWEVLVDFIKWFILIVWSAFTGGIIGYYIGKSK